VVQAGDAHLPAEMEGQAKFQAHNLTPPPVKDAVVYFVRSIFTIGSTSMRFRSWRRWS